MKSFREKTILALIAAVIMIIGLINCGEKKVGTTSLITTLKGESMMDRQKAFAELYAMGKKAIPDLIEAIDDTATTFIFLHNPISSRVSKGSIENYSGILAAYTIELIVSRDKLQIDGEGDSMWVFGSDPQNYIYENGVIARNDSMFLSYSDMKKIAEVYRTWWEHHNMTSVEGLRDEWKSNVRPLTGSEYHWE